jgi:hypothetical protein
MTGNELPDDDHVVRYVKPSGIRTDGKVNGTEFCLRPNDKGLSVNWLEYFEVSTKDEQLAEVRRLLRLRVSKSGRLAELNIGETKRHIRSELEGLNFIHRPLVAEADYEADPSHSEITGLPPCNSPDAELIGDIIVECIKVTHPTVSG